MLLFEVCFTKEFRKISHDKERQCTFKQNMGNVLFTKHKMIYQIYIL